MPGADAAWLAGPHKLNAAGTWQGGAPYECRSAANAGRALKDRGLRCRWGMGAATSPGQVDGREPSLPSIVGRLVACRWLLRLECATHGFAPHNCLFQKVEGDKAFLTADFHMSPLPMFDACDCL